MLDQLAQEGLPPGAIELEVTESLLLRQEGDSVGELRHLRDAGVALALDDFGTGYSSLSYLRLLPIDTLKIDKSFIAALDSKARDRKADGEAEAIVRASLAMDHSRGGRVVAAGGGAEARPAGLRAMQCDLYQGYLESRPVTPQDFLARYLA